MLKKAHIFFFFLLSVAVSFHAANALKNECECGSDGGGGAPAGSLVNINQRRSLVSTEYGEVWSVDVNDGHGRPYHIQFITLEPDSLFLPVLLHADMVFYVNTGSGRLSWTDDDEIRRVDIKRGDLYRLDPGTVFYVQSNLETERPKLRINAIFASNSDDDLYDPAVGAYSSIRDIVQGFDPKLLRSAFKVSEEVIESIVNGTDQSAIVHAIPTKKETFWDLEARFLKTFLLGNDGIAFNSKKKTTTYNIFDEEPDFENCNGWSLTVNKKTSNLLKGSNIGLFMVNLTKGSMMGPHWNTRATEIAIVLQGQGMVRVVCSSTAVKKSECRNMRFRVHEGDVFAVPRFHPMAQMSFNNNSLVFMGFSTTEKKNNPQFLAGKYSVLQTLDKQVLAASFNVTNTTIDQLLSVQPESFIIDCTSCAEEEEKVMLEEIKKVREEEEAKKREEEEAQKREQEEQERKREDEEAKKREEEERETQEEERKREEEARKREEEEATREREEQAARERGEQTAREREEQAAREREEQVAKQQEEQAPKEQEEQEAAREREEREAAREREEEGRQQEKEGRQGDDERRQQEKRERERRQQEEWKRREEDARREREEAQRQQEEGQGRGEQTEQEGGGGGFDAEEGRRYLSVLKI
ncbi:hypothetical protein PS2_018182 [Malus domestica]